MTARRGFPIVPVAVVAIVLAAIPWFLPSYNVFQLTYVGAYAMAILGLIVLTGNNGQISLGHGAFLAVGGYTIAIFAQSLGLPLLVTLLVAAVLCGVLGLFIGLVALRLQGVYLALATFALAVAVPALLKHFKALTGGVQGISLAPIAPPLPLHGVLTPERYLYYVTWILTAVIFLVTWILLQGRIGRSLRALRDNEIAAISFGINPYFYKTLAFGWSAAFAGLAGGIVAAATAYVSPDTYNFSLSITLVIGAVIGGLGTMWGALVGGIVIEYLPFWAQAISAAAPSVVYGVALILVMMFMPGGISGAIMSLPHWIRRRREPNHLSERVTPTPEAINPAPRD